MVREQRAVADLVLACALSALATLIVSGDGDLLDLGTFQNIRILAAREAFELLSRTP